MKPLVRAKAQTHTRPCTHGRLSPSTSLRGWASGLVLLACICGHLSHAQALNTSAPSSATFSATPSALTPTASPSPGATARPAPQAIELNSATEIDLDGLAGIGPALSRRILQARDERAFESCTDASRRVKGLGQNLLHRLSQQGLRVQGEVC